MLVAALAEPGDAAIRFYADDLSAEERAVERRPLVLLAEASHLVSPWIDSFYEFIDKIERAALPRTRERQP